MPNIPFTNNYQDLSSPRGFQFKFICQKCGNGYVSTFQTNRLGAAAAAADVAASLLGGLFGRAAQTADQLQAMAAGPQHDAALDAAAAGDQRALQAVHPLRQLGLRAGLLEQEGRAV